MDNKEITTFDKMKIFEEEIEPLIEKIDIICRRERMPYFFTCAVKNEKNGTKYISNMLSAVKSDRELENDVIVEGIKVLRGYHAVPSNNFEKDKQNYKVDESIKRKNVDSDDILDEIMRETVTLEEDAEEKDDDLETQENCWEELEPLYKECVEQVE